jgi:hypothetical protein
VAGLQLTIVGSSKRDTVRADLPGVVVCSNMEEVATHPEVDLLVIASPNESHYPLAAAALRAGKNVVVDKPLLSNLRTLALLFNSQRHKEGCSRYFTTDGGIARFWRQKPSSNQVCSEKLATLKPILTAFVRRCVSDGANRLGLELDSGSI